MEPSSSTLSSSAPGLLRSYPRSTVTILSVILVLSLTYLSSLPALFSASDAASLVDDFDPTSPKKGTYELLRTLDHPNHAHAFTQGLFIHNSTIYESLGLYEQSRLRTMDMDGAVTKATGVPPKYFLEGEFFFLCSPLPCVHSDFVGGGEEGGTFR